MSRELAVAIVIALAVVVIGLGVWGWRRRAQRDAAPLIGPGELPEPSTITLTVEALYVATTQHDAPLERIAAPGLGFPSKATVTVADTGVAVDLTGQERFVLTPERIVEAGQSTVAIDRVVEPGGLARLVWRTDAGALVDSYFRPQDSSARALTDAVSALLTSTQTGTDA